MRDSKGWQNLVDEKSLHSKETMRYGLFLTVITTQILGIIYNSADKSVIIVHIGNKLHIGGGSKDGTKGTGETLPGRHIAN